MQYFTRAVAAQVLRVTKLAPGMAPYLAWLVAWNYLEAEQTGNAAVIEALDLFLGLRGWEGGQVWSNYRRLVEMGRIPPVPGDLVANMEEIVERERAISRER
jgi:hypothetical protein